MTKFYLVFCLRKLKVGVLFILERKGLNERQYVQFLSTLRRRAQKKLKLWKNVYLTLVNSLLVTEINNQID